jgi:hypothetical protein
VKLTRKTLFVAFLAILVLATLAALTGHPVTSYLPPEALAASALPAACPSP